MVQRVETDGCDITTSQPLLGWFGKKLLLHHLDGLQPSINLKTALESQKEHSPEN